MSNSRIPPHSGINDGLGGLFVLFCFVCPIILYLNMFLTLQVFSYVLWLLVLCFLGFLCLQICVFLYLYVFLLFLCFFLHLFCPVCFVWFHFILLYLFLDASFQWERESKKGCGFGWVGRWGRSRRSWGRGTIIRIYHIKKKSTFNKEREKTLKWFSSYNKSTGVK